MATAIVANEVDEKEEIEQELLRLAKAHGGVLKTEDIVKAARPSSSVLHDQFTWDDSKAANEYRLWEARQLIRVHLQPIGDTENMVRVFVSLRSDRGNGGGYRVLAAVLSDKEHREQLLRDALSDLQYFKEKYALLRELSVLRKPIHQVLTKYKAK